MRKLFTILFMLFAVQVSAQHWIYTSAKIYVLNAAGSDTLFTLDAGTNQFSFQHDADDDSAFYVLDADGGTPIFLIDTVNERVGIGTLAPTDVLDVTGNIVVSGTVDGKDIATYAAMLNEAETITANWVNTDNPWAENELVSTVIVVEDINTYSELNAVVADVTLTHNGLFDTFAELDAIVADKTLINEEDAITFDSAITFADKLIGGSLGSPIDVTNTRQYGLEFFYGGNDYSVTGARFRGLLQTTDASTRTAQGIVAQASNSDNIDANVVQGALIEAIGKSSSNQSTISNMRGALIGTEWDAKDIITDLKTLHVRTHTRDSATEGYFSNSGYLLYLENEAVGGNGQQLDAGIFLKSTNVSTPKGFLYGLDFSGAVDEINTADFRLNNGALINNSSSSLLEITEANIALTGNVGIGTTQPQHLLHLLSATAPQLGITHTAGADSVVMGVDGNGLFTVTTVDGGGAAGHIALMPDGNVGINQASPVRTLDVWDPVTATMRIQSGTDDASIWIDSGQDGLGAENSFFAFLDDGSSKWEFGKFFDNDFRIVDVTRGGIVFRIQDNGDMRLMETGGNVGIGTTSPDGLLNVESLTTDAEIFTTADNASISALYLGDEDDNNVHGIKAHHGGDSLEVIVNNAVAMTINSAGDVGIGLAPVVGAQLLLPSEDDAVTPTIAFGDGDTGIYQSADGQLDFAVNGVKYFIMNAGEIFGVGSNTALIENNTPSATTPGFKFAFDQDTGLGTAAADQLSLISGGVELIRITQNDAADDVVAVNGSIVQETYVIRKHVALSGATDATATNWFTITTTDETGSADGGSYSVNVHLIANEAGAASGAANTAAVSLIAHWSRIMASAGTGANSAVKEASESTSADEGTGAISAVTITVTETSEFVQQVLLDVNTSGGTFDGFAIVELVYSDFTTPPVIN